MPVWLPWLGAKKRVDAGEGLIQQRDQAVAEDRPGIIIDIGDQNSKIIYLDRRYNIKNFTMNEKCAAGTGKFMEVAAQTSETTIDQVGPHFVFSIHFS